MKNEVITPLIGVMTLVTHLHSIIYNDRRGPPCRELRLKVRFPKRTPEKVKCDIWGERFGLLESPEVNRS